MRQFSAFDADIGVSSHLGAVLLDTLGLAAAVEWYLVQFQKTTGIRCDLTVTAAADVVPPEDCALAFLASCGHVVGHIARQTEAERIAVALAIEAREVVLVVSGADTTVTLRRPMP